MSGSKDKNFVETMMMANMAEIQLGQMGSQKATSPEVKSFAQMMVTDHTQANQELMPLAQQLGVQQPTSLDAKHKAVADRLSKLQGAEFDRQYMKAMVDAHKNVISQTKPIAGNQGSGSSAMGTSGTSGTMSGSGSSAGGSTSGSGATSGTSGTMSGSGSSAGGSTSGGSATSGTSGSSAAGSSSGTSAGASSTGSSGGATSVTAYAAKTLPIVQQHLAQAQQLEKTVGNSKQ
jgi:putative membrane protein